MNGLAQTEIKKLKTIEIGGRLLEDVATLKERLGIAEMTLWRNCNERGMPRPIKLGKTRYFDRQAVDEWLLSQMAEAQTTNSTM